MKKPETSIIIRAFNEQNHLPDLLEAIDTQTYHDYEVIVVDSGSFDRTPEIAQQNGAQLVRIESRDFTFGYSLNVGIRSSIGRYIAIVSAHTKPVDCNWLACLIDPLRADDTALVYGRQLGAPNSKYSEIRDFERTFGIRRISLKSPNFFANNANSAIRKDLWEQYPFDETLPGLEDIEWAKYWMEKGYHVVYEPKAAIFHIHNETWRQVRRRYYREGLAARWIEIKRRNQIPLEVFRESKYVIGDLIQAGREGCLGQKSREIVQFRIHKTVGTVCGLWESDIMGDPRRREEVFFDKTCKAVVISAPGRAALEEVEIAPVKPGDVLMKVAYVGVCATDLEIFDGSLGYYKSGIAKYPIIPGHEFSGKVVSVGPNVKHLREGDLVVAECIQSCGECKECLKENWIGCQQRVEVGVIERNGAYAEFIVLPGRFVHKLAGDMDLKQACLCEPIAVVLKGLKRLERVWGTNGRKTCAVVGAGPIGHLSALILTLHGHEVTVFDRNALRRSYFEDGNCAIQTCAVLDTLFDYETVVEATGDPKALDVIFHKSAPGSSLLLLGLPYARTEFNFESIVAYDKIIVGSVGSTAQDFQDAITILPQLDLNLFKQSVYPLQGFETAWEACKSRNHLKTLLEIDASLNEKKSLRLEQARAGDISLHS